MTIVPLVREVIEPYFWYNQRTVSATCTLVIRSEKSRKSGWYLQRIIEIKTKICSTLNDRIFTTTSRKCILSFPHSLSIRSTLWTLTKVSIPIHQTCIITRIFYMVLPETSIVIGGVLFCKVRRLCTKVERAWEYGSCTSGRYPNCY